MSGDRNDEGGAILQSDTKAGWFDGAYCVRQGFGAESGLDEFNPFRAEMDREASEENHVGPQKVAEIGADFADGAGVDVDDFGGLWIAGSPKVGKFFRTGRGFPSGGKLPGGELAQRCAGTERFDAACFAERLGTLFAEAGVADFETFAGCAAVYLAVQHDARAEARAAGKVNEAGFADSRSPVEFGEAAGGRIMLDSHGKPQAVVKRVAQGDMVPAGEVGWRQNDSPLRVERAADGCADGDDLGMFSDEPAGMAAEIVDHRLGAAAGKRWPLGSSENFPIGAADHGGAFGSTDVQAEKEFAVARHA